MRTFATDYRCFYVEPVKDHFYICCHSRNFLRAVEKNRKLLIILKNALTLRLWLNFRESWQTWFAF